MLFLLALLVDVVQGTKAGIQVVSQLLEASAPFEHEKTNRITLFHVFDGVDAAPETVATYRGMETSCRVFGRGRLRTRSMASDREATRGQIMERIPEAATECRRLAAPIPTHQRGAILTRCMDRELHGCSFRYWRLLIRPGAPPPDDGPCGPFRAGYSSIAMQSDEEYLSEPP